MHEGEKAARKLQIRFFCKAFVCWVWEIKADSCNIALEEAAETSKGFLFYLTECPVRPLHQREADGMFDLRWRTGRCWWKCSQETDAKTRLLLPSPEQLKLQQPQKWEKPSHGVFFTTLCKDRRSALGSTHVLPQTPCPEVIWQWNSSQLPPPHPLVHSNWFLSCLSFAGLWSLLKVSLNTRALVFLALRRNFQVCLECSAL